MTTQPTTADTLQQAQATWEEQVLARVLARFPERRPGGFRSSAAEAKRFSGARCKAQFRMATTSSGTRALRHRGGSSAHTLGRYKRVATGQARVRSL